MELTPTQINRLKAAAEIVDMGDAAVITKIYEFTDFVETEKETLDELKTQVADVVSIAETLTNGNDGKEGAVGQDGKDGRDGKDGKNGINGRDGRDGRDGVDGNDGQDGIPGINGVDGKDSSPDSPQEIADKINTLYQKIKPEAIIGLLDIINRRGLPQDFDVRIGVSQTELKKIRNDIITLQGSSGGAGFTKLTATGTVNDANLIFSFTQAPTYLIINGAWYDNTAGQPYTWTGTTTVTLNNVVGTGGRIWGFI